MTKLKNKGFLKLTALFIAVLFAHSAVMAESVPPFAAVTSSPAAVYFQVYSINFSGLPDNPLQIECPEDISTYTDINECTAEISNSLNLVVTGGPLASLTWEMAGATEDASRRTGIHQIESYIFNEGTTIVNYTARDNTGNTVSCSFTVTISDNQVPKLVSAPESITVEAGENECGASVSWDEPVVVDNCTPTNQILKTNTHISGSFFPVGTTTVTYTLDDGMATTKVTYSFTVTVTDRAAPVITAPANITVNCGEPLPRIYSSLTEFTDAGGAATDNCQLKASSFTLKSQTQSSQNCPYTVTRTYQISDVYNNVGTVEHLVYVGEGAEPEPEPKEVVTLKSGMADITLINSGNWNVASNWSTGTIPNLSDNVTIPGTLSVTIDAAAECKNITIETGGTVNHSGATTLKVYGDWTNNGTYNGGTNGVIEFTGANNATINGTTNFVGLIISKGSLSTLLTVSGTATVLNSGAFTLTSGMITIPNGGSFAINRNAGFTIPKTGGFDITGGNLTTADLTITNEGLIRISDGTATFGNSSGNSVNTQVDGAFVVSGGNVNIAGRLYNSAAGTLALGIPSGITITNGTVILATAGNGLSNVGSLNVTSAGRFDFTGGTIVFQNPSTATTELDLGLISGGGAKNTVGGTFQFGNASTPAGSVFNISSNIVLDKIASSANADLQLNADVVVNNLSALNAATTFNLNGNSLRLAASSLKTYNFPIDNGSGVSIPVTINLTNGTFGANPYIEIETFTTKHPENKSTTNYLNRYWKVTTSGITNPVYDVTATYADADIAGAEAGIAYGSWTAFPWVKGNAANAAANTISATGITSNGFDFTGITLAPPTVTIIATSAAICIGSSTTLTANPVGDPTFTYLWTSTPAGFTANTQNITVTPNATTTYTVTVTDGNGFTATENQIITVNPLPVGTNGTATTCSGVALNYDLQAQITNSVASNFTWTVADNPSVPGESNGSGDYITQTLTNSSGAAQTVVYTVTPASDGNNCAGATFTVTVTVNPLPIPSISGPASVCAGSAGNIYTTETGMSGYTWTVSAGGTIAAGAGTNTVTISWSTAGAQLVTVNYTNSNGCTAASATIYNITVNPIPVVTITNPPAVCTPATVDLTATSVTSGSTAGLTFTYFTDASGTIPLATAAAVTTSGTYYIKGTTGAGCASIKPVTVTINPSPTLIITNPAAVCTPATVNLSAAAVTAGSTLDLTYSYWTNASATTALPNFSTVGTSGTYYIKGTVPGTGCFDIKPVTVTVNQTPVITTANTMSICSGVNTNISLIATVPSNFSWTIGTTTGIVNGASAGSSNDPGAVINQTLTSSGNGGTVQYRVTPVSITGNCTGPTYTITVTVNTPPNVTLDPVPELYVCEGSNTDFSAAATGLPKPTVQWQRSLNGSTLWTDVVGATTNNLNIVDNIGYYYRVKYTNSCGDDYSTVGKLFVSDGSFINKQPTQEPPTVCAGGLVTITAKPNAHKNLTGQWQYWDGTSWVNFGPKYGPHNGTINVDYSFIVDALNIGRRIRIHFVGDCGSQYSNEIQLGVTSIVTTTNTCINQPVTHSLINGNSGGTWTIKNPSSVTVASGTSFPTFTFTPTSSPGCWTATYSKSGCTDSENFVVFPASPTINITQANCSSPFTVLAAAAIPGFTAEYAVQSPGGTLSAYNENLANINALVTSVPGCWTIKARYKLNTDCGTTLAGTISPCAETTLNAIVFPTVPALTAPSNTCNSGFILPSFPSISGFTTQWQIDGGGYSASPTIPVSPGCHTIQARYVLTASCGIPGTFCESNIVSVVIFPPAPPAPTVSAGCGPFTVTPPATVTGFNIEYSFNDGATWGTSNASPLGDNCAGYRVKTRYVVAAGCGNTLAGTASTIPACKESPATTRIVDLTPPALTCNTMAPAPVCTTTPTTYVHSGTSWDASVTDNCTVTSITASLSGATTNSGLTTLNGVAFNIGTTIVTWSATDGCNTSTCTFTVTVNPNPFINAMTATICSEETFTVTPVDGINGTVPAGTTYSWAAPVVAGITGTAAGTNAANISGTLTNTTIAPINVIYTVTPSTVTCPSAPFTVTVTVNPKPVCSISGPDGPVCPSTLNNPSPLNNYSAPPGMSTYSWSITGNGTISGATNQQTVSVMAGAGCDAPFDLTLTISNSYGCISVCNKSVVVQDITPPVLAANPPSVEYCVVDIMNATYDGRSEPDADIVASYNPLYEPSPDVLGDRPDYYIFDKTNTDLDLDPATYFSDNCTSPNNMVLRWSITDSGGNPVNAFNGTPLTNITGQVSAFLATPLSTVIKFVGAETADVTYTITYWLVDLCGNPSTVKTATITIKPRPQIIKLTTN